MVHAIHWMRPRQAAETGGGRMMCAVETGPGLQRVAGGVVAVSWGLSVRWLLAITRIRPTNMRDQSLHSSHSSPGECYSPSCQTILNWSPFSPECETLSMMWSLRSDGQQTITIFEARIPLELQSEQGLLLVRLLLPHWVRPGPVLGPYPCRY